MVDLMIFRVLAAPKNDGGWGRILIPLVIAIFYIVGAIKRTKDAKKQSMSESMLEKADTMAEMEFEVESPVKVERKKASATTPSFSQSDLRVYPQKKPVEKVKTEYIPAIDFQGQDSLRKAIIYHEIFSKPLSLRDASEENQVFE